jgi:hypothetical protein
VKIGGTANPDLVPIIREWIDNPAVRIVVGSVSVVDEDGEWARERARAAVEPYLEIVAHLDPTLELFDGQAPPLERFYIARPKRSRHASTSCGTLAPIVSSSEHRRAQPRRAEST